MERAMMPISRNTNLKSAVIKAYNIINIFPQCVVGTVQSEVTHIINSDSREFRSR